MNRKTAVENQEIQDKITEYLKTADKPPTIQQLRTDLGLDNNRGGLTRLIKSRFIVDESGSVHTAATMLNSPTTNNHDLAELCRRLVKTIERMSTEIDALQKENIRLRRIKQAPTLSDRVKKALATYGD